MVASTDLDATYFAHQKIVDFAKYFEYHEDVHAILMGLKDYVYVTEKDTDPDPIKFNRLSTEELNTLRDKLRIKGGLTKKGYRYLTTDGTELELATKDVDKVEIIITGPFPPNLRVLPNPPKVKKGQTHGELARVAIPDITVATA